MLRRLGVTIAASALLAACAGNPSFREGNALLDAGQVEQGMAKLEQALREDPHNAQFRMALLNRKAALVNGYVSRADAQRREGNDAEAEALYRQALAIDPHGMVAQQGLAALAQERRHRATVAEAETQFQKGDTATALELLRPVLQQKPSQREALRLKARIADAQGQKGPGRLSAAFRKPVTLQFRDAPVRSVFDFIGKVSGLNFAFDREVDPNLRATISVRDASIEEAVAMLLSSSGLEQAVTGERSITIFPNNPQKVKDYQQLMVRTFFLANAEAKQVAATLKTLLKARDIVTDDRLGLIIMRDTPDMVRMAERIIAVQDLADPEVMLEVEVLEVKRSRLQELGIRWPEQATLDLAGANATGIGSGQLKVSDLKRINSGNINLDLGKTTINAGATDTDSNILANPRIRVRNKDKAKILIGDRVPVITVTTNNGVSSDSVNYVDVGLKLDVEPNVYLDDEVAIKINLEVSNVVKEVTSKSGTQAYQIGTRSASTVLRLRDGETQVLAGLINDEDRKVGSKVPGVGDLPVLDRLFGTQKDDVSRSEIVLSITPRLLRSVRRPDLREAEFLSGTEASIGVRAAVAGPDLGVPAPAGEPPASGRAPEGEAAQPLPSAQSGPLADPAVNPDKPANAPPGPKKMVQ
jgi:general secretion pathway protein D